MVKPVKTNAPRKARPAVADREPSPDTPAPDGCATCRFSLPTTTPNGSEFICRRYPPQIKVDGVPAFPQLTIYGWCGEFQRPVTVTP